MFIDELQNIAGCPVRENEPLSQHTSFRTGGPADFFVSPRDASALARIVRFLEKLQKPYFLLGNGTNVLASDAGFRGVVVNISKEENSSFGLTKVQKDQSTDEFILRLGAGVPMREAGLLAASTGAQGFEALSGIPGTVGGGVVMNAGAYGSEFRDVLSSVKILDTEGNSAELSAEEAGLRYRGSFVQDMGYIVTEAIVKLRPGSTDAISERMEELRKKRLEKQPLEYPSAGSTFKRPEGFFAGQLIEEAGLKGRSIGGAEVSRKHAGFIVNTGRATSGDILSLIRLVQREVLAQNHVLLEPEIRFLGDFGG